MRGNHNRSRHNLPEKQGRTLTVPLDFPGLALNKRTIKLLNTAYYYKQLSRRVQKVEHYNPFFYPLDAIYHWNRAYGKRGFFQYQCVVPFQGGYEIMREILTRISASNEGSFVTVLKQFGDIPSPGLLSFPRPGLTIALDFPNQGRSTLRLFEDLDVLVRASGGAVYPAKDARMDPVSFQTYFPRWREFEQYIDPKFSSSFWRRVATPAALPLHV